VGSGVWVCGYNAKEILYGDGKVNTNKNVRFTISLRRLAVYRGKSPGRPVIGVQTDEFPESFVPFH
jgi:hypothetical protein